MRYDFWAVRKRSFIASLCQPLYYSMLARIIEKTITEKSRVLEIGPGKGLLGYSIADRCNYSAIEASEKNYLICKEIGLDVFQGAFPEYTPVGKVDLIIASHVLEHSPEPYVFCKTCFDLLNKGGKILLIVPDAQEMGNYFWANDYTHIFKTSIANSRSLLEDAGFKNINMKYCYSFVPQFPGYFIRLFIKMTNWIFRFLIGINANWHRLNYYGMLFARNIIITAEV